MTTTDLKIIQERTILTRLGLKRKGPNKRYPPALPIEREWDQNYCGNSIDRVFLVLKRRKLCTFFGHFKFWRQYRIQRQAP